MAKQLLLLDSGGDGTRGGGPGAGGPEKEKLFKLALFSASLAFYFLTNKILVFCYSC